jgi:hypothetical protein
VKTEEIQDLFRKLKARLESGEISENQFEAEVRDLLFQDDQGNYWTIGAQTEKWYSYEAGEWVQSWPPPKLERVEGEGSAPDVRAAALPSEKKGGVDRRLVIGLVGVAFVACLLVVAVIAYQLGKTPAVTHEITPSPTLPAEAVETPTAIPASPTTAAVPTSTPEEVASPTPEATATEPSPSPTRSPTSTSAPEATATPEETPVFAHPAPVLLEPEDGAERGPGYEAVLVWKPVDGMGEDEYYHVEVCWNDCSAFWGEYVRETTWTFPDFRRGDAVDTRYYWTVTVRRQLGDSPAGPSDPATSPPSQTWMFMLPE